MIQKGKHEETLRILLYFALFALFVGQGSAARIVRSGIWWWLVVLRGDNCHSGGPVQHSGFVGWHFRYDPDMEDDIWVEYQGVMQDHAPFILSS